MSYRAPLVGLRRTMDWYFSSRSRGRVQAALERQLTER